MPRWRMSSGKRTKPAPMPSAMTSPKPPSTPTSAGITASSVTRPRSASHPALSGRIFLVNSGAEVSTLPPTASDRRLNTQGRSLHAANGSPIRTYGTRTLRLNFGGQDYEWPFIIANVEQPLLVRTFSATLASSSMSSASSLLTSSSKGTQICESEGFNRVGGVDHRLSRMPGNRIPASELMAKLSTRCQNPTP